IGKPLLIIWDGVGMHKSRRLRQWLETQGGAFAIAFLPPYAPELNPVEAIWAYPVLVYCLRYIRKLGPQSGPYYDCLRGSRFLSQWLKVWVLFSSPAPAKSLLRP